MIKISADTRDLDTIIKSLRRKSQDFSPATAEIAGIMLDAVEENFDKEGRPVAWQPLAPSTIKQRTKEGTWPGKKLQRSGDLASSVQPDHDKTSASVSTNKVHGPTQHFGRGPIPARPFMNLAYSDTLEVEEVLRVFLDNLRK